jgi:hypothetical protein
MDRYGHLFPEADSALADRLEATVRELRSGQKSSEEIPPQLPVRLWALADSNADLSRVKAMTWSFDAQAVEPKSVLSWAKSDRR